MLEIIEVIYDDNLERGILQIWSKYKTQKVLRNIIDKFAFI